MFSRITEDIVFEINNVMGGNGAIVGLDNTFTLSIEDDDTPIAELAITEWLNNPLGDENTDEWFEIYNFGTSQVDLNGYSITRGTQTFTIGMSLLIDANSYIVFAKSKTAFETNWLSGTPTEKVVEYTTITALSNSGDNLTLKDNSGRTLWAVTWANGETAGVSTEIRTEFDFTNLPGNHPNYNHDTYPSSMHYANTISSIMSTTGDIGTPCAASDTPLPLDFLDFSGKVVENEVLLEWTTANEQAIHYFSIERSQDNRNFVAIGKVISQGDNPKEQFYHFKDANPHKGVNYYRLKQIDWNGRNNTSASIAITYQPEKDIILYPNLVREQFTLQLKESLEQAAPIEIFNTNGQLLHTTLLGAGDFEKTISVENWSSGIYFVKLGNYQVMRFVKH